MKFSPLTPTLSAGDLSRNVWERVRLAGALILVCSGSKC